MSQTARATPRSGKFSDIRQLKGSRSTHAEQPDRVAADTDYGVSSFNADAQMQHTALQELKRQQAENHQDADANTKVQRQRYVQLVMRMSENARHYNSLGLFVDAMLRELLANHDLDVATVAAAATWALNLLATQGQSGAPLRAIADALLPAVYCDYSPSRLERVPVSVRSQLKDVATIRGNPYLTHTMYVEQVSVDLTRVDDMVYSLERALQCNDARRHFIVRTLATRRTGLMRQVLCAWRGHARRTSALRRLVAAQGTRHGKVLAAASLGAAFHQWKVVVETSRNTFLTERLHEAAFQLENAKNQFQLQCYRADRLAQTAKDAKEELQKAQAQVDELTQRVGELEAELVRQAKVYAETLSKSVSAALSVVRQCRSALGVMASLQPPTEFYVTAEAQHIEDEAARQSREDERLLHETIAGHTSGSVGTAGVSPDTSHDFTDATKVEELPADEALRRWCNHILALSSGGGGCDQRVAAASGKRARTVRNFSSDFASGEVYLLILHHVFPEQVSLAVNQESNTECRLRRIRGMCESVGLDTILEPNDFIYQREDRVFVSVSELYARAMAKRWRVASEKAAERLALDQHAIAGAMSSDGVDDGTGDDEGDAAVTAHAAAQSGDDDGLSGEGGITDEAFSQFIAESRDYLRTLQGQLAEQSHYEKEVVAWADRIRREKTFLMREREGGAPVAVVGSRGIQMFLAIPKNAFNDLRANAVGAQSQLELWDQLVAGPLRAVLREKAAVVARFFYFYAGEGAATMFEFDFWSFVETGCAAGLREILDKSTVSDIFDRVISPQLATALRTASVRADMDAQTVLRVARREMDVRKVGPAQFMEILVRIGVAAYSSSFSVVDAVRRVFDEFQLPLITHVQPVVAALLETDIRHITEYFADSLVRIFFHYVRKQENSTAARERNMAQHGGGRFGASLAVSSFLVILQDANFLIGTGTRAVIYAPEDDHLRRPFVHAAQVKTAIQELRSRYLGLQSDEMVFSLFVEVISVLPHYWCPDPLVPAARKYAAFLSVFVKQLIAFHTSSTLVLGNPPEISLQGGKRVDLSI